MLRKETIEKFENAFAELELEAEHPIELDTYLRDFVKLRVSYLPEFWKYLKDTCYED